MLDQLPCPDAPFARHPNSRWDITAAIARHASPDDVPPDADAPRRRPACTPARVAERGRCGGGSRSAIPGQLIFQLDRPPLSAAVERRKSEIPRRETFYLKYQGVLALKMKKMRVLLERKYHCLRNPLFHLGKASPCKKSSEYSTPIAQGRGVLCPQTRVNRKSLQQMRKPICEK